MTLGYKKDIRRRERQKGLERFKQQKVMSREISV